MNQYLKYQILKILVTKLNIKHKDFLISNSIIVVFTILMVLILNYFLTSIFGFDQNTFYPITFTLVVFGSFVYYFLSKQLIEPLFKSEEKIKSLIKETLHELNTPVATIKMNTKILQKKQLDEKNIARLERIDTACNDLLDLYSTMEYGIKEQIDSVTSETFNIDEIINKSISKFEDIKGDINIEYVSKTLLVEADLKGFEKVIDNLISNGIKYNKSKGFIKIYLNETTLVIQDSGIGIDTQNLFAVFERYYQESTLNSGIGLGLNIVKEYCDKHKIDIKIDSKKDEGSIFYLDLKNIIK